jgi:lipid II:glycine glycyltransferase (peptidoglycan interpeptide bridge formation enzyme)
VHDQAAIYYYGASASAGRELMAPYALQWAAMRQAKALGATSYDLLGIAPPGTGPMHPWAGISDFKRKFGGTLVTYLPERQITLRPLTHAALQAKRRWLG